MKCSISTEERLPNQVALKLVPENEEDQRTLEEMEKNQLPFYINRKEGYTYNYIEVTIQKR